MKQTEFKSVQPTDDIKIKMIGLAIKSKQGWKNLATALRNVDTEASKEDCKRIFDLIYPDSFIAELCKNHLDTLMK